ncbi:MAG: hypothetical protein OEO19_07390 [Gammaproteobacteria bacterium]|nr:hypothetical protein [Gammaproteobacteria bacterium]MDH3448986.1 hypothetical protein [Gammaproteobacteria bacterium]
MIVITVMSGLGLLRPGFNPLWIAGIGAWGAALLLFADTTRILKIQVSLILLAGIALMIFAAHSGARIDPDFVISSSTGLMTMIASVGFLRLVVIPDTLQAETLPVGRKAFLQTIVGLNISSSVINISAPILISDRIHRRRPLQRFTAQTFTRVFCGVSSWSPFFGAMAVVLTYVSDASLLRIIVAGFPFTLIGIIGVYVEARLRYADEVENFVGYPTHLAALRVPAILIVTVIAMSWLLSDTSILVLIAISALLVTSLLLALRSGIANSASQLRSYVFEGLPRIVNELCLFLSAGVLAAGISALILHGVFANPFDQFDSISAAGVLAIMVFCAFCGIHPIIMISSFAPMILTLNPDPNLLAATFLFAWHLGTCSNPLSGTSLVFQGRYGIPGWKIAFWNWPYAIVMLFVGALWLQLVARFFAGG